MKPKTYEKTKSAYTTLINKDKKVNQYIHLGDKIWATES